MPQNFILYECGHREFEKPSPLKKLKRALSIKRVLSNKSLEAKDIRADGLCIECAKDPIGSFLGKQVSHRTTEPLRAVDVREDDPHSFDEEEFARRQGRSFSEAERFNEEEEKAGKLVFRGLERQPTRLPRRPVGSGPLAQGPALSYHDEDLFADGKDPFKDGSLHEAMGRWVSVKHKEGEHVKGASEGDDSAGKSDEQRKK